MMLPFKAMQMRLPTLTTADLYVAHTSCMKFVQRKELFSTRPLKSLEWSMQAGIVAIIAATLFLRTHLHPNSIAEGQLYSGFLFFSLLQMFFSGIAEMTFAVSILVAVPADCVLMWCCV